MGSIVYSKYKIIELVKEHGGLAYELDHKTYEKRLNNVIAFLKKDRVQERIRAINLGIYFNDMNFRKAKHISEKGYNYNFYDALFLFVLVSLYENNFFKKIRTQFGLKDLEKEAENWMEVVEKKMEAFKPEWEKKKKELEHHKSWDVIKREFWELFYIFTIMDDVSYYNRKTQFEFKGKMKAITELFERLPDDHKQIVYDQSIKNRLQTILNKLEEYPTQVRNGDVSKNINPDPREARYIKSFGNLVEIDKRLEHDANIPEYLKGLFE